MASTLDSAIVFSDHNYSMREIVESLSQSFPLLCRTTTGYSGCDEDILQIGSGETFWVFQVHRQQRLVVKSDKTSCYLSIPIEYPTKVQIVQDGSNKVGVPVSIREIRDVLNSRSSSVKLIFENNCKVSFQMGADMGSTAKFDVLTVQQVYDEKYLLAYSICNRKIFPSVQAIPVYLPIEFSVANGLADREVERWSTWTETVTQLTRTFKSTPFRTTQEIILFNEKPSNGEYDYIKLSEFSHFKEKDNFFSSKIIKREKENVYKDIPPRTNQDTRRRVMPELSRNHSLPLPRLPPPTPRDSNGKGISVVPKPTTRSPAPTPSGSKGMEPSKGGSLGSREAVLPGPKGSSRQAYESLDQVAKSSSSSLNIYASLSEVPSDIDVSSMTVEDVVGCLELLKLTQHSEDFRRRQIDGGMVMCMTEKMLVEDFDFRSFDATQFMSFAKRKWRPKRAMTFD